MILAILLLAKGRMAWPLTTNDDTPAAGNILRKFLLFIAKKVSGFRFQGFRVSGLRFSFFNRAALEPCDHATMQPDL